MDSDRSLLCAFGDEVLRRQRERMQRHGDNSVEGCLGETWKTGLRGAADLTPETRPVIVPRRSAGTKKE